MLHVKNPLLDQVRGERLPLRIGVGSVLKRLMHSPGREDVGFEAKLAHEARKLERVNNDPGQDVVVALSKLVEVLPEPLSPERGRLEEVDDRTTALCGNSSAPISS